MIRMVIFDWAGTTIDFGSLAPIEAFVEVFRQRGVVVSRDEARKPMGTHKLEHLRRMLTEPAIADRWRRVHGQDWSREEMDEMYHDLVPIQLEAIDRNSQLIPGLLDVVADLRGRGIVIGGTTGYFRSAAERVAVLAAAQGYAPDVNVCGDDVPAGRPAPWMVYRCMERAGVYPPSQVLKIGDTLPDIEEGLNAGVRSVGVIESSSEIGLTVEEWNGLDEATRRGHRDRVAAMFRAAGADDVIANLAEIPRLLG